MEISWTDRVKNKKNERNIVHTIKMKEGYLDWSHLQEKLPYKNITKPTTEVSTELKERRGRRCKQSLDDLKEIT